MHYYEFTAIIFADGQIRDVVNATHRSEEPSHITDFRHIVELNYAGPPDTYSAIKIGVWYEIDQAAYDKVSAEYARLNEAIARRYKNDDDQK